MASRVSRWALIAGIALVAMLVVMLPPGEAPLPGYGAPPDEPTNAIDGSLRATREAQNVTGARLSEIRRERALVRYRASAASPVVLAAFPDSFTVDRFRTHAAEVLWKTLPTGTSRPRTLLILGSFRERIRPMTVDRCEARLPNWEQGAALYAGAGGCYLQAMFGLPGAGLRSWIDSLGGIDVPRPRSADRAEIRDVALSNDFLTLLTSGFQERFAWWAPPELEACAAGRTAFCSAALRFAPVEAPPRSVWSEGWVRVRLVADVPAALFRDLGPERFAILWRSDRPVPEAYRALTGRSFDEWAERYVQRRVGRVVRHTALDLGGWLGWGLWMGLLGALMGTRLRAQGVLS